MREYAVLEPLRTWKKKEWVSWIKGTIDEKKDVLIFPQLSGYKNPLVNIFSAFALEKNDFSGYHEALLEVLLEKLNEKNRTSEDRAKEELLREPLQYLKKIFST